MAGGKVVRTAVAETDTVGIAKAASIAHERLHFGGLPVRVTNICSSIEAQVTEGWKGGRRRRWGRNVGRSRGR